MKRFSKSMLVLCLLSPTVFSTEYLSPVQNIQVTLTDSAALSIQNFSSEQVVFDIYGETIKLVPASGIQFECLGYETLELQIKNIDHDYFEIPCQSRVVIGESFTTELAQGE